MDASPLWVAIGVLIVPNRSVVTLPPAQGGGDVAWRLVTTDASQTAAARVVVVPCPDGYSRKAWADMQFSCFCKAAWWFRRALLLFPRARYIAKVEDDSLVHAARLVAELQLMTLAGRAPLHGRQVWYGHFGWAVHDGQRGAFCGSGDDTLRIALPHCRPGWSPSDAVVAPFASGGLDVRSRALASRFALCDHVWTHLHHRDFDGDCDGLQGYFLAMCMDGGGAAAREVTALHLPELKFHPPPASLHSTVLHPHKSRQAHDAGGGSAALWLAALPALLPLAFTLQLSGGQHLGWTPQNRSVVASFLRHRDVPHSLCEHVPCG